MIARAPEPAPLDVLLAAIPSLPRPVLSRLTARLIERLDELDGDTDLEPEEDYCLAGDDGCGPARDMQNGGYVWGSEHDEDYGAVPEYSIDQRKPLRAPPARDGAYS